MKEFDQVRFKKINRTSFWPPIECEWCGMASASRHDFETDLDVCLDCVIRGIPLTGKRRKPKQEQPKKKPKRVVY